MVSGCGGGSSDDLMQLAVVGEGWKLGTPVSMVSQTRSNGSRGRGAGNLTAVGAAVPYAPAPDQTIAVNDHIVRTPQVSIRVSGLKNA